MRKREEESKWKKYRKPLLYAVVTMSIFYILWFIVVWSLARCLVLPNFLWTLLIPLVGLLVSADIFHEELEENKKRMKIEKVKRENDRLKLYEKPLAYAALTMIVFMVIWMVVVLLLIQGV